MGFAEVVKLAQTEVQTAHVLVSSGSRDRFLHCRHCFTVATKVGLKDREVQEGILVEGMVAVVHGIVKVTMEIVEG